MDRYFDPAWFDPDWFDTGAEVEVMPYAGIPFISWKVPETKLKDDDEVLALVAAWMAINN
jgi:hypothetical protein